MCKGNTCKPKRAMVNPLMTRTQGAYCGPLRLYSIREPGVWHSRKLAELYDPEPPTKRFLFLLLLLLLQMANNDRFLRVDPSSVEGALRWDTPVNGHGTTTAPPPPQQAIGGPAGAGTSVRPTPVVGFGDAAGSSANAAYRYQEVEQHLYSR